MSFDQVCVWSFARALDGIRLSAYVCPDRVAGSVRNRKYCHRGMGHTAFFAKSALCDVSIGNDRDRIFWPEGLGIWPTVLLDPAAACHGVLGGASGSVCAEEESGRLRSSLLSQGLTVAMCWRVLAAVRIRMS